MKMLSCFFFINGHYIILEEKKNCCTAKHTICPTKISPAFRQVNPLRPTKINSWLGNALVF